MSVLARLAAFALLLALALGGGAALGTAVGPIDVEAEAGHGDGVHDGGGHDDSAGAGGHDEPTHATEPGATRAVTGLQIAADGHRLVPEDRRADDGELAFRIIGPAGLPITEFDPVHERPLHLIVASRQLDRFLHLHPTLETGGRWRTELPELPAGSYRAFADFRPRGGPPLVLGVDLLAGGPVPDPEPVAPVTQTTVDGYDLHLEGTLAAGRSSEVVVTVHRGAEIVTPDPYLGARGHLVALRDGDLAYLHVHPVDGPGEDDPGVRFAVEVPSAGTYALFFDFLHQGEVRTARFVVEVRS